MPILVCPNRTHYAPIPHNKKDLRNRARQKERAEDNTRSHPSAHHLLDALW